MQRYLNPAIFFILSLIGFSFLATACNSTGTPGGDPADSTKTELVAAADRGLSAATEAPATPGRVLTGPEVLVSRGLESLRGLQVGVVANHTSLVFGATHLVDTLLSSGIAVKKVFAPEHGFRGTADAGEKVQDGVDAKTGLPILSLYGKNRKPSAEQLKGLDIIIFDIQDIGSRHYTYIGTLAYVMEACAESGIPFLVLDRPNPNGWYVDGPVLEARHASFIGMHAIPIAHGMTIAEYAQMVNGEQWLKEKVQAELQVSLCEGYDHSMTWDKTGLPWVPPSPNIATEYAAYLYPAICWFEATNVSLGRGTHDSFTILGAPWYPGQQAARATETFANPYGLTTEAYAFTPVSLPGKSKEPPFQDELCQGYRLSDRVGGKALFLAGLALLKEFYQTAQAVNYPKFWLYSLERWAGNTELKKQIEAGMAPEDIYASWQEKADQFRQTRKKYLLYPDF